MATQSEIFRSNMAGLWTQPDGPNTDTYFLGCYDVGDLTDPQGEVTQAVCPDPSRPGQWLVVSRMKGVADRPTFSITHYLGPVSDWLETSKDCPMNVFLHQNRCGRVDDFLNYERAITMPVSMAVTITETGLMMRTASDESEQTFEFSSDWLERLYPLTMTRRVTTEDEPLNDVAFCNNLVCAPGACGPAAALCTDGVAVSDSTGAAPGDLWVTRNAGLTWGAQVGPYGNTEDLNSEACVGYSPGVVRIFVARSTLAATFADVAYSDDWGVTWTTVLVGGTNTEFATGCGSLFALDAHHIWFCTDTGAGAAGNVYFSSDAGLTWTLQTVTAAGDALNYIRFIDKDHGLVVGDTDEFLYTLDGGTTWQAPAILGAAAGSDVLCCDILDAQRWWVGYDDAQLWYTRNGGTTWFQRTFTAPVTASALTQINDIMFVDDLNGFFVLEWVEAANLHSSVYRTMDGGLSWEMYAVPVATPFATDGLHAIWACEPNHAFAVGDTIGGTAAIEELAV